MAAGADRLADARTEPVDEASDLLQAGARGGDDADGAAPDHIGETERNPVEDGGAAVRTHDQ